MNLLSFLLNYPAFFVFAYLAWKKRYFWLKERFVAVLIATVIVAVLLEHSFFWVPLFMIGTRLLFESLKEPERTFSLNYSSGLGCFIVCFFVLLFMAHELQWIFVPVLFYLSYQHRKEGFFLEETAPKDPIIPIR